MNRRLGRLICRVRNHHNLTGLEIPIAMTVHRCNTCDEPLVVRLGTKARVIGGRK